MPDNAIDRFDALVETLNRLVALHRGQPSAEDWARAIEAGRRGARAPSGLTPASHGRRTGFGVATRSRTAEATCRKSLTG